MASDIDTREQHRRAQQHLAEELRRLIRAALDVDASAAQLADYAQRASALASDLELHPGGKSGDLFHFGGADPSEMLPFSPVMGRLNPMSPPLALAIEGDRLVGRVELDTRYEGAHGTAHGGVVAELFDEMLAIAAVVFGVGGPTANLSVRYRKPMPLHRDLRLESWIDRVAERKVYAKGTCHDGDTLVAEAEGLFLRSASR